MFLLAKYGVQTDFYFPMIKRGVVDLAVTADWTPATGDTKVSKTGGAVANATNNPVIASGASWKLTLTATELTTSEASVQIIDSATKAVEDQFLTIYTYGNPSAKIVRDLSIVNTPSYTGTAQAGSSTTITLQAGTTALQCVPGDVIRLTGGAGAGETAKVTAFNAGTAVATIQGTWQIANPDNTSVYEILKAGEGIPATPGDVYAAFPQSAAGNIKADIVEVKEIALQTSGSGTQNIGGP